jgi:hypothetical protein
MLEFGEGVEDPFSDRILRGAINHRTEQAESLSPSVLSSFPALVRPR